MAQERETFSTKRSDIVIKSHPTFLESLERDSCCVGNKCKSIVVFESFPFYAARFSSQRPRPAFFKRKDARFDRPIPKYRSRWISSAERFFKLVKFPTVERSSRGLRELLHECSKRDCGLAVGVFVARCDGHSVSCVLLFRRSIRISMKKWNVILC